jgi:hypothetical protein
MKLAGRALVLFVLLGTILAEAQTQIRAFDAVTLKVLYTCDLATGGRDTLGQAAHFIVPTIANGKVYVATQSQLVVYGNF